MTEILALLQAIAPLLSKTTFPQMSQVVFGMLVASGRITMLGLSRWTEKGGSYRTIQRFYHSAISWKAIQWLFFRERFLKLEDEYIIAGDEVLLCRCAENRHADEWNIELYSGRSFGQHEYGHGCFGKCCVSAEVQGLG